MAFKVSKNTCVSYMIQIKWCLLNSYSLNLLNLKHTVTCFKKRLSHMFLHVLGKYLSSLHNVLARSWVQGTQGKTGRTPALSLTGHVHQ